MNSDPRFRPHVEDRLGSPRIAIGIDMLIMARQMAMEISEKATTSDVDPNSAGRDSKPRVGFAGHHFDDTGPSPSNDDAADLTGHGAIRHTGHVVGPLGPEITVANSVIQPEVGGHGPLSLSAPTLLSGLLTAIGGLPVQWTLSSGAPGSLSPYQGTQVAPSDAGDSRHVDYRLSGSATNIHIPSATSALVSGLQNPSYSPAAPTASAGLDDVDTKHSQSHPDIGHVALSSIMQPVTQTVQAFVSASAVEDGTHVFTAVNLIDSDFTKILVLPDASVTSLTSSFPSATSFSRIAVQDSVTQSSSNLTTSQDTSYAGLGLHFGNIVPPTFPLTSNLSSSSTTPFSPDNNITTSTPIVVNLGNFSAGSQLAHNAPQINLVIIPTAAPLPALPDQAPLASIPTHFPTFAPVLLDPTATLPTNSTAATTSDPTHLPVSAPALTDQAVSLPVDLTLTAAMEPTLLSASAPALPDQTTPLSVDPTLTATAGPTLLSTPAQALPDQAAPLPVDPIVPAVLDPTHLLTITPAPSGLAVTGADLPHLISVPTPAFPAGSAPPMLSEVGSCLTPDPSLLTPSTGGTTSGSAPSHVSIDSAASSLGSMATAATEHTEWNVGSASVAPLAPTNALNAESPSQGHLTGGQQAIDRAITPENGHNESQQTSSISEATGAFHASNGPSSQSINPQYTSHSNPEDAHNAIDTMHTSSMQPQAGPVIADAPGQAIHLSISETRSEQAVQTTQDLRHESALTESGSGRGIVPTSFGNPAGTETAQPTPFSISAAQNDGQDLQPNTSHYTQLQDHFTDHQFSSAVQGSGGHGNAFGSINVAYSTTPDVTYGPSGTGVSPQVASCLLNFLERLETHTQLSKADPSTHDLLNIIHPTDPHESMTVATDQQSSHTEHGHIQDTDLYHTNNANHAVTYELTPFHSFDHHG